MSNDQTAPDDVDAQIDAALTRNDLEGALDAYQLSSSSSRAEALVYLAARHRDRAVPVPLRDAAFKALVRLGSAELARGWLAEHHASAAELNREIALQNALRLYQEAARIAAEFGPDAEAMLARQCPGFGADVYTLAASAVKPPPSRLDYVLLIIILILTGLIVFGLMALFPFRVIPGPWSCTCSKHVWPARTAASAHGRV